MKSEHPASRSLSRRTFIGASAALMGSTALLPAQPEKKWGQTPNTKFAVNVEMWWKRLPFLERVRQAAAFGYPAIEFWPYGNKDIDGIAKICNDNGMEVAQFTAWGFSPGLNNPENHDDFVRVIEESCGVADKLPGCELFTVVCGNDQRGMTLEEMHGHVIDGLKRVAPIVEKAGKTIIIEPMNPRNHPGHCLYGSSDAIEICKAVGSPNVKINWDLYHMQIVEGDLCMRMREGFDYIGYLQLADNPGRWEPGTGEINYARVYKEAHSLGYDGYIGLECNPKEGEEIAAKRVYESDLNT